MMVSLLLIASAIVFGACIICTCRTYPAVIMTATPVVVEEEAQEAQEGNDEEEESEESEESKESKETNDVVVLLIN